ncbi:3-keto-5-aminohexanoate cleavage protein [Phytohabitans sp. ZYX-F-186]|uniref:3-keto-5-aminohexanoate cleavage protein n=1 Tax=Phytohabitans maris TaxID=3071409 RepID=A0ABU0ZHC2_9ACTN|nr:3-keto-5-aminohexanoate cleavage protein [Phytohabitans sp. ZYX-F-186]MDQ7906453.1 3-keto-5-aminohexanoate cleavage protein [Phytohabitans sp. ZYX-F-186]
MLKACLNGGLRRDEHPAVPITPAEVAADAVRCESAGAAAVHVHPRDEEGRETLAADAVDATVAALRRSCPELPVGVTTGAWIAPDSGERVAAVESWSVLPDFASVNVHEEGAERVAAALRSRGIGVEAGLWTPAAVAAYQAWRVPCVRLLLECMEPEEGRALANAHAMLSALGRGSVPILLHAEGAAVWAVLREARRLGLHSRVGLEDTRTMPDGTMAPDNRALVEAAMTFGMIPRSAV